MFERNSPWIEADVAVVAAFLSPVQGEKILDGQGFFSGFSGGIGECRDVGWWGFDLVSEDGFT